MIDIGANLTHGSFRDDLQAVLARAREAGVQQIIVTGTTVEDSRQASALGLPFTTGVHPHHARDCGPDTI
ncbi:MAG: hydrolase TatD, partial [Burkholderiales bacterium]|nr:hydrolase TatD [Burkholderiales bacterium]